MKRVLILSAPIGSGHKMTAAALAEELRTRENVEVVEGDVFSFMPAWIGKTFLFCYLKVLALCPWLYGAAYSSGGSGHQHLWLRNFINRTLLKLGKGYLQKVQPDIVLATHATPLGIMSIYKEKHPEIWLGAVVPDFNIHPWWNCQHVDAYFLADALLKEKITTQQGIYAYGLPIRKQFSLCEYAECRARLGYKKEEKLVLLMGGGDGLLPMEEIVAELVAIKDERMKLIVVAGRNEQLLQKLQARFDSVSKVKLELYGYREDIPQLMTAADILISKGGAVTAAEALATGISYIIYKPLPGQEEGNAKFLQEHYGAFVAKNLTDVAELMQKLLLNNPAKAGGKSWNNQASKTAAKQIINLILEKK